MSGTYASVIRALQDRVYRRGIHYQLDAVASAVSMLGLKDRPLPKALHVAGTNGKGSTLSFMAHGLFAAGYQVGTFTSPHLFRYNERVQVNMTAISDSAMCRYLQPVLDLDLPLTEFEVLCLMSWSYFADQELDYVIYETGLGGRLDATQVITPILSVITRIDMDHMELLGETIAQIAAEKAGIIREGVPVITLADQHPEALQVIDAHAQDRSSLLTLVEPPFVLPDTYQMKASFQAENLALARAAVAPLLAPEEMRLAEQGFAKAVCPGRFQVIDPALVIVDAAHNPHAIRALVQALRQGYPEQSFQVIAGILARKNANEMLTTLSEFASELYLCDFDPPNSMSASSVPSLVSPVDLSHCQSLSRQRPTVVTGSIFFLDAFLRLEEGFG